MEPLLSQSTLITALALLLVVTLDWAFLALWRRRSQKRLATVPAPVYVLGAYSPVFTWLQRLGRAANSGPHSHSQAAEAGAEALAEPDMPAEPELPDEDSAPHPRAAEAAPVPAPQQEVHPEEPEEPLASPAAEPAQAGDALLVEMPIQEQSIIVQDEQGRRAHIHLALDIPEGMRVRFTVEAAAGQQVVVNRETIVAVPSAPARGLRQALAGWTARVAARLRAVPLTAEWAFFGLALVVYLFTRLWAIDQFPIYFFGDEAAQTVYAERLLNNHFIAANDENIPVYIEIAGNRWEPFGAMYFQAVALLLFGKSILVTRGTSAVLSLLAAASVALVLKYGFKQRHWWAGALLVGVTPVFFLHARTAFETVTATSLYGCFLLFYILYRTRSPNYLFAALAFGAATFYSYSNAQLVMGVTGLLLFFSDLKYHFTHWRQLIWGMLLAFLLAWPFFFFRDRLPEALSMHLRTLDSYWFHDLPLQQKFATFFQKYLYGLSPQYWFFPNEQDLERHRMAGTGHFLIIMLPLIVIGAVISLWNWRSPAHRAVLLAALAAPVGAALVDIGVLRMLAFVIPANILIGLGLGWLLDLLERRFRPAAVRITTFAALAGISLLMLRVALVNGPLWFHDYGLYGMQYGARQIFEDSLPAILKQDSTTQVVVSPSWANGAENLLTFFVPESLRNRVQLGGIDDYLRNHLELDARKLFIVIPEEYTRLQESRKFDTIKVERILPYPDGSPGFFFVRLAYAANIDAILQAERDSRKQLKQARLQLEGQPVLVAYSQNDMGEIKDLFDGDTYTLVRGLEANPFVLDFTFSQPQTLHGLWAAFGSMDFELSVALYTQGADTPVVYDQVYRGLPTDPQVTLNFDNAPPNISRLHVEIHQLETGGGDVHIHIRELKLLP